MPDPQPVVLSKTSKMPCRSWSLRAIDTCPGARAANGELVPACEGCYATDGNYHLPSVKNRHALNAESWQHKSWVQAMANTLINERYFRWFDSGDMYKIALAKKIKQVMEDTPWVSHWLPTRMHKYPTFAAVIKEMRALSNVVVRASSDGIRGELISGQPTQATIVESAVEVPPEAVLCRSYEQGNKCGTCRACWDKTIPVVAYIGHGRKIKALYKGPV